ncbi:MAG: alcohol dehydrogenase catalytic domain-containing protein [Atopobiaceae bacterium]|jgi:L-iditol 2-dehydrogenase|nr:alcohol dehydrogenase catalytic domain-containing protein [Atopobiaceae bacterium]
MKNSEAILTTPGTMKIFPSAVPEPKDDEVLIEVEYVGICGSDVHGFQFGPFIPPKDPNTKIGLGHEFGGRVVSVGSEVTDFKPGDRVCAEPGVPDGTCHYCLEGRYNICPDVDFMATQPNYKGALTHYIAHPANFVYHLPENMDTMEGALVEPASVGMHAALVGGARLGKRIVILGSGCIGLMTLQACKSLGASEIVVVDVMGQAPEDGQAARCHGDRQRQGGGHGRTLPRRSSAARAPTSSSRRPAPRSRPCRPSRSSTAAARS